VNIKEVFTVINQMQADGVIERYAVGGAVGATFYLEPVATLDVDVFVAFQDEPGSILASLKPIFDYLKSVNGVVEGEYVILSGWPVQFLPPVTPLVEEALKEAVVKDVDGVSISVFTAEHLAAIALETGRAKDKARLLQFIETCAFDIVRFQTILAGHGLSNTWHKFERQFLSDTP
jgi:hypothetical protein